MPVSGQLLIQKQANGSVIYYREEDNEYNSEKQDKENNNLKYNEYIDLSAPKKNSSVLKNDADLDTKTQQNSNEKSNTTKQDEIVSNKETNKNDNDNKDDKDKDNKDDKNDKDDKDDKNKETDLSKVDAKVEEPIKVFNCEVKSPLEWLLTDDKIITPFGAEKISNDYIELVSYIFSTFIGSGLGLFLISTGVFSGLGMAILLYANTPTPVIKHLCKKVDKATCGCIPLGKYKSITEYTIKYINNSQKRISDKVKKKEEELKIEREFQKRKQEIIAQTRLSLLKQQTKNVDKQTNTSKQNNNTITNKIINDRNKNTSNVMTI